MKRSVLVIGHPRCGSGYMAKLLSSLGLDVGHEKGTCGDGISNWAFAVEHDPGVFDVPRWGRGAPGRESFVEFEHVIHHVRNPISALPSICYNEVCFVTPDPPETWEYRSSFLFRYAYIYRVLGKSIDLGQPLLDVAIQSFLYWNEVVCLNKPDLTVRVEECEESVNDFLNGARLLSEAPGALFEDKQYNSRDGERMALTPEVYYEVRTPLLRELDRFCHHYGYPSLFGQIEAL